MRHNLHVLMLTFIIVCFHTTGQATGKGKLLEAQSAYHFENPVFCMTILLRTVSVWGQQQIFGKLPGR